jgi:DHA1 family bicyclomycin/chloramphenicol resistance-like MFS transporter
MTGPVSLTGRRRIVTVVTLGALSAFGPLSFDLYLPSLPALGRDLHAGDGLAQLTMSMCMAGLAAGQLLAGTLSDRIGRRRPLLVGISVYTATSLLCAVAPTIWILIGLRLVQGLAGAAGLVIARAIVRDLFRGDEAARVFSSLLIVSGLAPVAAPLAGGQLARVTDWRGIFVVLAFIGLALLAAAVTLPETLAQSARHTGGVSLLRRHLSALFSDRQFIGYALVLSVSGCTLFTYISLSSFVLQDIYGVTAELFSFMFAANSVGILLGSNLNRVLVGRRGPRRMLVTGVTIAVTGSSVAALAVLLGWGLFGLLPGLFVAVSSVGFIMPNATALGMDRHGDRAGTASALMGTLSLLVGAIVPPVVSHHGATARSMTLTMMTTSALAVLIVVLLTSRRRAIEVDVESADALGSTAA